jgi:hypothetical protein
MLIAVTCLVGCQATDGNEHGATMATSDQPAVATLDFGTIAPGSRVEREFRLKNDSSNEWPIARVGTSCECVTATAISNVVAPGSYFTLLVTADFSDDASYQGNLCVRAKLQDESSQVLKNYEVHVAVSSQIPLDTESAR